MADFTISIPDEIAVGVIAALRAHYQEETLTSRQLLALHLRRTLSTIYAEWKKQQLLVNAEAVFLAAKTSMDGVA